LKNRGRAFQYKTEKRDRRVILEYGDAEAAKTTTSQSGATPAGAP
jgi:hypothetical protein